MGRELKRVPLDFDYPMHKVWYGYYGFFSYCHEEYDAGCDGCKAFAKIKGIPDNGCCPDYEKFFNIPKLDIEPPEGEGYQLWETTSEGSPSSPVFDSLEKLCEWCEENATTFGNFTATKEEWKNLLSEEFFAVRMGNTIFI